MRTFLGLFLLLTLATASAEVYRWTDAQGVIHYGDKPPKDGVKPVNLPPLQTYSPKAVDAPTAAPAATAAEPADAPPAIRIIAPAAGETVRGNGLSISVEVKLLPSQGLLYFLDGVQQNPTPTVSLAYLIENAERGEHTLGAAVVGAGGRELSRAAPITVHMKPPIVPPPPPPRPAPAAR